MIRITALKDWSIRHKLLAIVMAFNVVFLLFLAGGIIIYDIVTYIDRAEEEINDISRFIAANSASALAFEDPDTAREILNTLSAQPQVAIAALYATDNVLFAAYRRSEQDSSLLPDEPGPARLHRSGMTLEMVRPVRHKGELLGTLYLRSDIARLHSAMMRYAGFLGVTMLAVVAGAFLLQIILHKMITEPLLNLAGSAKRIAGGDLSHRVSEGSKDEFGQLAEAFNQMTTELNYTYAGLQDSRDKLKIRVAERTAEVEERSRQLQQLALSLSEAEDRERQQIALMLHDDLQQYLAAVRFHLQRLIPADMKPLEIEAHAEKLIGLIDESIQKCRSLSHDLSPPVLHQNGLFAALEWLARDAQTKYGLTVDLQVNRQVEPKKPALAVMLYHSIRELVFNAAKHSGSDSVLVAADEHDGFIRISVSDQGKGSDHVPSRSGTEQGVGFGLFAIEEKIRYMGGRFFIHTAPGKGFCVTLDVPGNETAPHEPAEQDGYDHQYPPDIAEKNIAWSGKRILLADDHAVMRQGLANLIEQQNDFAVVGHAADGREAVYLAGELQPDVILMDISMPDIDGIQATAEIAAVQPGIKIIGLSMHDDVNTQEKMMQAGACAYLYKAAPAEEIIRTIRET
jgi:signal transduction histidine kinase